MPNIGGSIVFYTASVWNYAMYLQNILEIQGRRLPMAYRIVTTNAF